MNLMFFIPGRIPSKKNSRLLFRKKGKTFNLPSNEYRKWENNALDLLKIEKLDRKNIMLVKHIYLIFYMPDNRRCDLTNRAEGVLDLLVKANLIFDDSWQIVPTVILKAIPPDNKLVAGVRVEIEY